MRVCMCVRGAMCSQGCACVMHVCVGDGKKCEKECVKTAGTYDPNERLKLLLKT